ncbi:MAG TPA: DUF4038 domain-containing protein [Bacteroidales bacterium]|nr:DUF4038 domain-containing protein [Bacteroidales bacterium]
MFSRSLILFYLCILSVLDAFAQTATMAVQWKEWEYVLTSEQEPDSAGFRLKKVEVEFQGPGGRHFTNPAFTDDGIHYTIRAAFPSAGSWRWKSDASIHSDDGLHHVKGSVEVAVYMGTNPFYIRGDLRVSENRRFLEHDDGTPFLWIGDTGWNIIRKASLAEWKEYVDTRAEQGFNVIQVNPRGTGNKASSAESPDISFTTDGRNDTVFWNDLENKIRYANEKGIIIMLAGTGTAWKNSMAQNERNQDFISYICGRLAGLMVIFSPGYEQVFTDESDKLTAAINKKTNHLITQYTINTQEANLTFRQTTSVDFTGLNAGSQDTENKNSYYSVRQWTFDLFAGNSVKPVITLRSVYDAYGNDDAKSFRGKDARKTGWIAFLSGSKGYTYGAGELPPAVAGGRGGVWAFNTDSSSYDYWRKAIRWESAGQMKHLSDFLKNTSWWDLLPAQDIIRNQETVDTIQMVASRTEDSRIIAAYMPSNPRIVINMSNFLGIYRYIWFDPRTGQTTQPEKIYAGMPNQLFTKPEGWDDAAILIYRND